MQPNIKKKKIFNDVNENITLENWPKMMFELFIKKKIMVSEN